MQVYRDVPALQAQVTLTCYRLFNKQGSAVSLAHEETQSLNSVRSTSAQARSDIRTNIVAIVIASHREGHVVEAM